MWLIYVYIHTHNGILLRHKRNETGSFVVIQMNLKSVIQSEVGKRKIVPKYLT